MRSASVTRRTLAALILITLGATFLIAAALLHLSDYPKDLSAVGASNLRPGLKGAVRSLYFLVAVDWIAIASILLIIAFSETNLRSKTLSLGGIAVLANTAVMLANMGWFIGTGIMLASALMILGGGRIGYSLRPSAKPVNVSDESERPTAPKNRR
jgi:hypothetical protein